MYQLLSQGQRVSRKGKGEVVGLWIQVACLRFRADRPAHRPNACRVGVVESSLPYLPAESCMLGGVHAHACRCVRAGHGAPRGDAVSDLTAPRTAEAVLGELQVGAGGVGWGGARELGAMMRG